MGPITRRKAKAQNESFVQEPLPKRRKVSGSKQDDGGSEEESLEKPSKKDQRNGQSRQGPEQDHESPSKDATAIDAGLKMAETATQAVQDKQKPVLKRFGSEDPEELPQEPVETFPESAQARVENEGADDSDSDSDAPEEAIIDAVEDHVAVAEAKAAEARAKEQESKRARRQEHNRRMQDQKAAAAKKSGPVPVIENGVDDTVEHENLQDDNAQGPQKQSSLPVLLPEELLATEFNPQISLKPAKLQVIRDAQQKHKRLLDMQDKPPKDLRHGNTRIRVLAEQPSSLPPKSTSRGKHIREAWLLGQRGNNEKTWTPRATASKAFARKPKRK